MYWAEPCKDNDCSAQVSFSKSVRMIYAFLLNEYCNSKWHQQKTQIQQTQTAIQYNWLRTNSKNSLKTITPNITRHYAIRFGGLEAAGMGITMLKKVSSHLSFRKTFSANKTTGIHHPVFSCSWKSLQDSAKHLRQKAENKARR